MFSTQTPALSKHTGARHRKRMEDRNKNKGGILLLGLVRVSDRAVLASFAADTRGFTGAALKEVSH